MSPSRPTLRIRPRSAIADAALARAAVTDLPGTPSSGRRTLRGVLRSFRPFGPPAEPERVIVMELATVRASERAKR